MDVISVTIDIIYRQNQALLLNAT